MCKIALYNISDNPRNNCGKGGKGGGKSKEGRNRLPMHSTTQDGRPIYFNYNLGKCSQADCPCAHVCCVPNCYKQRPQIERKWKTAPDLSGKRARFDEAHSSLHAANESSEATWVPKPDKCYCTEISADQQGSQALFGLFFFFFFCEHLSASMARSLHCIEP